MYHVATRSVLIGNYKSSIFFYFFFYMTFFFTYFCIFRAINYDYMNMHRVRNELTDFEKSRPNTMIPIALSLRLKYYYLYNIWIVLICVISNVSLSIDLTVLSNIFHTKEESSRYLTRYGSVIEILNWQEHHKIKYIKHKCRLRLFSNEIY
jgi:tellurite resistance protein TehA-like permease